MADAVMALISTLTGDDGTTGLMGPERVSKDDLRIEALGALDEAQSMLGLARSYAAGATAEVILAIQRELYRVMGEVSTYGQPNGEATAHEFNLWTLPAHIEALETDIKAWRESISGQFIIPGASSLDGALHVGRALVRRAERRLVSVQRAGVAVNPDSLRYLNRLSDWVYAFAQHVLANPPVAARTTPKGRSRKLKN
jgi:cob(I)alamin adenosyltransferase